MIFLIEKLWTDSLENEVNGAYGYDPHSYVDLEETAIRIVKDGGIVDKKQCWAFIRNMPMYKYTKINKYNEDIKKS